MLKMYKFCHILKNMILLIYLYLTANEGFVGCIKNLYIQNEAIDPINLSELSGIQVYGVKLDGCKLVDHCLGGTHCEHGGTCVSDWDGVICDCSKTPYIGKACHFRK